MKRWLSRLLLLGALLGLLGQETAFAHVMPAQKVEQTTAAAQMSPDCAAMMGLAKQSPQPEQPCHGMTPECIAKMGCAIPVALIPAIIIGGPLQFSGLTAPLPTVAALVGRETRPEPEPPADLG